MKDLLQVKVDGMDVGFLRLKKNSVMRPLGYTAS